MKKYVLILSMLLVSFVSNVWSQTHWESIVTEADAFKYLAPDAAPSQDWIQLNYDDSSWSSGQGGFGFGDQDDNTIIETGTSFYLRKKFTLPATTELFNLLFDIDYDDAYVAFLNGIEIGRSPNLPDGAIGLTSSMSTDHEAQLYSGGMPERVTLNPDILVDGENILAVQIINWSTSSSDMSARVFLNAEIKGDAILFHPVPDWFQPPVELAQSNLPLIKFDTQGNAIPDEPKIMAEMQVINNASGLNSFNDTNYEYNGWVGIEIRGNTAQMFPKKSYTVETRLEDESNNNVELLGMPEENDWVLHAPYSDKTLMRNVLAYHIGNSMGKWNPHTRFVEVMLNGEYRGVYVFVEKIKIDKNRVDIATLKPEDITGDELTGGYIMSIDRNQDGSFDSPYIGRTGTYPVTFSYVDPKYDEINDTQRNYIRDYIFSFEDALKSDDFKDPDMGYRKYIDVVSFIDYFLITELSKDIDGYRVSVYFHKDKDSKGGKLTMSPFWDYNLCFGNANFYGGDITTGWTSDDKPNGIGSGDQGNEIPFWWDRFREDPYFETLLKYRWEKLRKGVLNKDSLNNFLDSCAYELRDAQVRNFIKYPILGTYIWPNPYVGGTYENEISHLKTWLSDRIDWLDTQINAIEAAFPNGIEEQYVPENSVAVYPNPFKDRFTISFDLQSGADAVVVIRNILGQVVSEQRRFCTSGKNAFDFSTKNLGSDGNIFFYSIRVGDQMLKTGKIIRQ
ncbi:CotH kinase family protein [Saccharicrinis sp. FJH54]|uniref:CotH kinase family protein n=1 Tax=Saccharicrinis sp. FJH54 TaxID=3344665 RepID=UPI0035D4BCAD